MKRFWHAICFLSICLMILAHQSVFATYTEYAEAVMVHSYAVGNAVSGYGNHVESAYKNPAILANLSENTVVFSYSDHFESSFSSGNLGAAFALNEMITIGCHTPFKLVQGIPISHEDTVTNEGVVDRYYSDIEGAARMMLGVNYSDNLNMGLTMTYLYHLLDDDSTGVMTFGAGLYWEDDTYGLGVAVQNLGNPERVWDNATRERIPQVIHVGAHLEVIPSLKVLGDMSYVAEQWRLNVGGEYQLSKLLDVLFGINDVTELRDYRFGANLSLGDYALTYAFSTHEAMGVTNKIGIAYGL